LQEWAVGNVISKDAKSVKPNGVFTRTGGGELSEEEEETILALLKDRDFAKCEKDYAVADSIRERLNVEFQVQVDDINREWHVVTSEYVQARDSVEVEASVQEYISSQVAKRAVAKLNKEYDVADEIRDELETEYNVRIDDRVKVWSVQNAPSRQSDPESGDLENVTDIEESEPLFENISEEDLQALTVPELKERLKAAGKPVSGRKAELIERLVDA
jgi:cysteinyl-tRNA synthetase